VRHVRVHAVSHRVAHRRVGRLHVHLQPQHHPTRFPPLHRRKQRLGLRHGAVATLALHPCHPLLTHLLHRRIIRIKHTRINQPLRTLGQLREIIRSVRDLVVAADLGVAKDPEIAHVLKNVVDVLILLFRGVGVVKPHAKFAFIALSDGLIDQSSLGVPDVEIPRRLGRETDDDGAVGLWVAGQVDVERPTIRLCAPARGDGGGVGGALAATRVEGVEGGGAGGLGGDEVVPTAQVGQRGRGGGGVAGAAELGEDWRGGEGAPDGDVGGGERAADQERAGLEVGVEALDGGGEA
jgi:hypothetical protein